MTQAAPLAPTDLRFWAPPLLLAVYFLASAWLTSPVHYAAPDLALLAALYLLLALVLHGVAVSLMRVSAWLGAPVSCAIGAVLVWHLREQGLPPETLLGFAVASLAAGLLVFVVVRAQASVLRSAPWPLLVVATLLLVGSCFAAFRGSETFRWHLLRHNKLLGTPAYYALAPPVGRLRAELWERHPKAAPAAVPFPSEAEGARPHLVFIMVDTLRADALEAYGGSPEAMQRLNERAARSVVFGDVLANATWTRPSVASFFTGLLQEEHGAVDRPYRLASDRVTLAERLREAGYETAAFVSNFAAVGRDAGFDQGFAHFEELRQDPLPYARAERVNEAVLAWLDGRGASDPPVFLYVHYLDPHTPYLSGGGEGRGRWERARSAYDAELRYTDLWVAKLFAELESRLPGPLHVLLTSDHGEEFGEHGEMGHGHSLYPEVAWLPTLLWSRGGRAARVDARLEARDFYDLFAELARGGDSDVVAWARQRERGLRYASIYSTTPSAAHRPYLSEVCMRAIEADDFQLIWSAYGPSRELYARESDPERKRDVARAHPERLRSLMGVLESSPSEWATFSPVEHSDDTVDLLRRLGYVE